jgi:hypothetical protein
VKAGAYGVSNQSLLHAVGETAPRTEARPPPALLVGWQRCGCQETQKLLEVDGAAPVPIQVREKRIHSSGRESNPKSEQPIFHLTSFAKH